LKNLVETTIDAGNFKTLIQFILEADLIDIIRSDGPFTIFAPTDEAFSKLPDGVLLKILEDKERLTEILTYHVVPNKIMSEDVLKIKKTKTFNGKEVSFYTSNGVKIDQATITKSDIECSNGVIHVIDEVLIPH